MIATGLFWIVVGNFFDYTWKKLQISIKSKQFYFGLRGLKYQFLYNYEGWRISRKRKDSMYVNYEMSKKELQHFCQMLISDVRSKSKHN